MVRSSNIMQVGEVKNFEQFLQDRHAEQYKGFDYNFNNWLCNLDTDSWLQYGNMHAAEKAIHSINNVENNLRKKGVIK